MRGVDPRTTRRDELLERFELDPTKKGRAYSKGNRQKVALVAAFAADVDLLVLDEPTSGLDPLMEQVFNECLAEHEAEGTTVLLSSHILSEVERLADRVTHHPRGPARRVRHARRAAPPAPQPVARRGVRPRCPDLAGARRASTTSRSTGSVGRLLGRPRRPAGAARAP